MTNPADPQNGDIAAGHWAAWVRIAIPARVPGYGSSGYGQHRPGVPPRAGGQFGQPPAPPPDPPRRQRGAAALRCSWRSQRRCGDPVARTRRDARTVLTITDDPYPWDPGWYCDPDPGCQCPAADIPGSGVSGIGHSCLHSCTPLTGISGPRPAGCSDRRSSALVLATRCRLPTPGTSGRPAGYPRRFSSRGW